MLLLPMRPKAARLKISSSFRMFINDSHHYNVCFILFQVLRSPDGESKGFPIGQMSVQRAAAWILDKYYTEFSIYNPFLDRLTGARNRKGVKYDMEGPTNVSASLSPTEARLSSAKRGFFCELDKESK